jgi:hypothetical protein
VLDKRRSELEDSASKLSEAGRLDWTFKCIMIATDAQNQAKPRLEQPKPLGKLPTASWWPSRICSNVLVREVLPDTDCGTAPVGHLIRVV